MQGKSILIIGGAGYIGSQVNKTLMKKGFNTIIFDNLSRGDKRSIVGGTFVEGDTGSLQDLKNVFLNFSIHAVMHFAASISVEESVNNPAKYYKNNFLNTANILDAMRNFGVDKLVFSSTAAVYGSPLQTPITEEHPCNPINPYGRSKWMVEQLLQDYAYAYGLRSVTLRYFNACGGDPDGQIKRYSSDESNLIPVALQQLLKTDGLLTVFGADYDTADGTCIRDYIHVQDLAEAHCNALTLLLNGMPSSVFNLGNGYGHSVQEVIDSIQRVTKKTLNISLGERRKGDPAALLANSEKAQKILNWRPQYADLDTMITHAWNSIPLAKIPTNF